MKQNRPDKIKLTYSISFNIIIHIFGKVKIFELFFLMLTLKNETEISLFFKEMLYPESVNRIQVHGQDPE